MGRIVANLNVFNDYITAVKYDCTEIQNQQVDMERAFRKLGECWSDTVYVDTGRALYFAAKGMDKIHTGLRMSVKAVTGLYNDLCEYARTGNPLASVEIPEYVYTIKEDTEMPRITVSTDPEALADFVDSLQNYIEDTEITLAKIRNRYVDIKAYWSGEQYDEFGRVIATADTEVRRQLDELDELSFYIEKQYRMLVAATKRKIDNM